MIKGKGTRDQKVNNIGHESKHEHDNPSIDYNKQLGNEEGPAVALELMLAQSIFMHEGALAVHML